MRNAVVSMITTLQQRAEGVILCLGKGRPPCLPWANTKVRPYELMIVPIAVDAFVAEPDREFNFLASRLVRIPWP
jgi:hypothetical protein